MKTRKILHLCWFAAFIVFSNNVDAQNKKADGYMGLWFKNGKPLEYGYKYSGGLGTFSSQHTPLAIYSPEAQKTFFIYGGTSNPAESHLQIMISYFDHRLKKVPRPVIVYDKMGVNDPQDNASLSIDSGGYLWIFISGRGRTRPGLIFKSNQPWSIESFDLVTQTEILFPQPWWMKTSGFILMYTKVSRGRELYWSTSSDGKTWSAGSKLASMGGHFQVSAAVGNSLFSVFNYFVDGNMDKRTNLYLVHTEDFGKTWKTVDNKIVKTPLTDIHNEALIRDYESEKKLVYIQDLNFDSNGNPVILALISRSFLPGPAGDPREWTIIRWKENKWNFTKVCESFHNYDVGALYIRKGEWQIIGPTEQGPQKYGTGGEIALWISKNQGESWEKVKNLTNNSVYNNSFVRRPVGADKKFYAFWADGKADSLSVSRLYFTNEKCEKIWMLPYSMKKELENPIRVK